MNSPSDRARAWLLFEVADPAGVAQQLVPYLTEGGDEFVVIRIDILGSFGLMVPVDARDDASLQAIVETLGRAADASPTVFRVTDSRPPQATRAHSYVTEAEQRGFKAEFPEPGRQVPSSPGANPWG